MATRGWENATATDVRDRRAPAVAKPSKYRNVKTVVNGEKFDSKSEAEYWLGLLERQRAGEIRNLRRQVPFDLMAPKLPMGGGVPNVLLVIVAQYIADYVWEQRCQDTNCWHQVVADAKSPATRTAVYRLKAKWLELQSGIVITEV